ncbi:MAG: NAD(P)/FAD-dependent oxidoreductase, partial [Chloroflexi bacterium]|nr:NAD(P)/FAD-dependent oxidoreductase [Chloroflexota bacterium]
FDAIVVGGGHNGLVCAALLAEGGLRTLVVESREVLGGPAETRELVPGVRVPVGVHSVGRLHPGIARRLDLRAHGLALVAPAVRVFAPDPEGGPGITLWSDPARTASELRARWPDEAPRFEAFDAQLHDFGRIIAELGDLSPPDMRRPGAFDAMAGLRLAARARGYGRRTFQELLRIAFAPVADVVTDALRVEPLRAAIAWRGVRYAAMGVRSAGTALNLLRDSATAGAGAAGEMTVPRGGPGALIDAIAAAARARGVVIRTGAPVSRIDIGDGVVAGVTLTTGEAIGAGVVVSALDPKRTLLDLVDAATLGPTLAWRVGNIRTPGVVAKVNLVVDGLPRLRGVAAGDDARLRGRIVLAPSLDAIERAHDDAKSGRIASVPILEATIPTLLDPSLGDRDATGDARHVLSVMVQYVPHALAEGSWDGRRDELTATVLRTLEVVMPGIAERVLAAQTLTPLDLERDYGLTGGHPMHAEMALDQFFAWRPMLGLGRYRLPFEGLYLAGSGAHPGGGITGVPGANAAREILSDWRRRRH